VNQPYRHPSVDELREIYRASETIAAVGASSDPSKAPHRIPAYLAQQGFKVIAVSPRGGELFGERVRGSLVDIDEPVDVVDVFRPAKETPGIAEQAAAIGAKVLWLQEGIVSNEAAAIARGAGMTIVMDLCMGTTHARLALNA
jgi:predicted CoA-binding protein